MGTIQERVARGVVLLDEHHPDWDEKINLDVFDVWSYKNCIVGQLYDGFWKGLTQLGVANTLTATEAYGFDQRLNRGSYSSLTTAWRRVIEARRVAPAAENRTRRP